MRNYKLAQQTLLSALNDVVGTTASATEFLEQHVLDTKSVFEALQ